MGWMSDDSKHEGYVIGLVESEPRSGLFRELTYLSERDREDLHTRAPIALEWICVGCDCGWRSPRMVAPRGTDWTPYIVHLASGQDEAARAGYEESARKMWCRHVKECADRPVLTIDMDELDRYARDRAARAERRLS